jgi:hypothetical protein
MSDHSSVRKNRRIRLGLALAFIIVGGAIAIQSQAPTRVPPPTVPVVAGAPFNEMRNGPRNVDPSAPPALETRISGRVWTRLPGVNVAGLRVQLEQRVRKVSLGPSLGIPWAETDASGRFVIVGDVPAAAEGEAEVYLHSPLADERWTYSPARMMLRPGRTTESAEIELIEGVEVVGQFVDDETEAPATPVRVTAIGPGRAPYLGYIAPIRKTDDRGSFRFRLAPGAAELVAFEFPTAYIKSYPKGFRQTVDVPRDVPSITLPPLRLRASQRPGEADRRR